MPTSALDNVEIITKLERTYAEALFELTEEAGVTETIADELEQLAELVAENDELRLLLENPAIGVERRAQSIDRLFQTSVSELTYKFLRVLNDKRRLDRLTGIAAAFAKMLKDKRGEVDVRVTAATPLDEAQISAIASRLTEVLQRKAVVNTRVDASLIAGLKIEVGDRLIDGSAATRLQRMQKQLTAAAADWARERAAEVIEETEASDE